MTKINQQAMNALTAALAACSTAAAIEGAVAQYLRQWGASERQIKIYPNGLAKVHVLDKDLALIGEYTRPAISVFDRREGMARQLRQLAKMATGLAEKIEA